MSTAPLPIVRLRLPCADVQEYRRVRASEYAARGVFVPSTRARSVGTRVHLKIELRDKSLGHDGEAIVARHVATGPRPGYVLKLASPEAERASAAAGEPVPAAAPAPAPAAPEAAAPIAERRDSASLAEFLFADMGPPDAPADLGAAGAPVAAVASPGLPPPGLAPPRASPRLARREPPASGVEGDEELATSCTPPPEAMADGGDDPVPARAHAGVRALARRLQGAGGYRRAAPILAAVLLSGAVGGETLHLAGDRRRAEARAAELVTELRRADDRLRSGRLAVPAEDSALDHLVAARALVPDDARVTTRLKLLSGLLGELGERALARGDLEEADAHFRATLRADPGNAGVRRRLDALADRAPSPPRG